MACKKQFFNNLLVEQYTLAVELYCDPTVLVSVWQESVNLRYAS